MHDEMMSAIQSGNADTVAQLLATNPVLAGNRDESGASTIQVAAYHGHKQIAVLLAEHSPAIDFFEACVLDDRPRVRELIEAPGGSDLVNQRSQDGFPALGLTAYFGHLALLELLLEHGADPNLPAANAMRVAPLNSAVANRDPDKALSIAKTLLAAGCNVDPRQAGGWTPLHSAAAAGHEALVELLLKHGADRDLESDDGRNASAMARERGHQHLASRLASSPGES